MLPTVLPTCYLPCYQPTVLPTVLPTYSVPYLQCCACMVGRYSCIISASSATSNDSALDDRCTCPASKSLQGRAQSHCKPHSSNPELFGALLPCEPPSEVAKYPRTNPTVPTRTPPDRSTRLPDQTSHIRSRVVCSHLSQPYLAGLRALCRP